MRSHLLMLAVLVCFSIVASTAYAQGDEKPAACSAPEHRQFDFWIGYWTVTANDKVAGLNKIVSILGGCVLIEEYVSESGYTGKSINRYDPVDKKWHQLWVDNRGGVLDLAGEYKDGKMIMEGESVTNGETVLNRITWFHNKGDGTVRQLWEVSKDSGDTWSAVFDGLYSRAE